MALWQRAANPRFIQTSILLWKDFHQADCSGALVTCYKSCLAQSTSSSLKAAPNSCATRFSLTEFSLVMRIDSSSALTLAAFIRSALTAIDRIETHVTQFNLNSLSVAELDSLGYSLPNIYNALENCFEQISMSFENHVRDTTRWHRELLEKMFLDIPPLRPAVLPEGSRSMLGNLVGFRHVFRHAYDFKLDHARTIELWNQWLTENADIKQSLNLFANDLEKLGNRN